MEWKARGSNKVNILKKKKKKEKLNVTVSLEAYIFHWKLCPWNKVPVCKVADPRVAILQPYHTSHNLPSVIGIRCKTDTPERSLVSELTKCIVRTAGKKQQIKSMYEEDLVHGLK